MKRSPRSFVRHLVLGALAGATLATPADAVPISPGQTVVLPGANQPGTIIRDALIPFEIQDAGGNILFRGVLQDRVTVDASGRLAFQWRIRDTLVDAPECVVKVSMTNYDYPGGFVSVDWSPNSIGSNFPFNASRSGDGSLITYDFANNSICETEESRFFWAATDATDFALSGSATITLSSGHSTTVTIASPFEDDTPPIAQIDSPSDLECVCDPVQVFGVADDPDGTYSHDTLEYRPLFTSTWNLIGQNNTPTPAPGGLLYTWNTGVQSQGYYALRLSVFNTAGLDAEDQRVVFLDKQFDVLNLNGPVSGGVYGGVVCPHGVLDDHCGEEFEIEYASTGGGPFQVIDPSNPQYTGPRINQTFGTWDTLALGIPDGDYTLRVTARDPCGHSREATTDITVDNTPPSVTIITPANCDAGLSGIVDVIGSVSDQNLAGWSLQYTGGSSNTWVTIATGTGNVSNGLLGQWDTTGLDPCCYTLRLIATDQAILNCNGAISHQSIYLTSVDVGCRADFNGDGLVNTGDILAFLNVFTMGCP